MLTQNEEVDDFHDYILMLGHAKDGRKKSAWDWNVNVKIDVLGD